MTHASTPQDDCDSARNMSLLVFSDDWGRHPSSCQHLIRRLLTRHRVLWVNTIGMRRPRFDRVTAARVAEKLRGWLFGNSAACASRPTAGSAGGNAPEVADPKMWPFFTHGHDRRINRVLLRGQLTPAVQRLPQPRVAITTIPIVVDLIGQLPVDAWVYYCVDDFRHWPEMDGRVLERLEAELIARADLLVAAGAKLHEGISKRGYNARLLTHGVDYAMWQTAPSNGHREDAADPPCELADLKLPIILFWGSINWQLDVETIRGVLSVLDRGSLVLVGPVSDCPPSLLHMPRVHLPGAVPYERLPQLAAAADVLVMPYRQAPGLEESQPLKLLEYLSTDRPAVVCDLPAVRPWHDALDVANSPRHFAELVKRRVVTGLPAEQAEARRRVASEGWDAKAALLETWIGETVVAQNHERDSGDQ